MRASRNTEIAQVLPSQLKEDLGGLSSRDRIARRARHHASVASEKATTLGVFEVEEKAFPTGALRSLCPRTSRADMTNLFDARSKSQPPTSTIAEL